MAEEKNKGNVSDGERLAADLILGFLILIVLAGAVSNLSARFANKDTTGGTGGPLGSLRLLMGYNPLTENTPLGTVVKTKDTTSVYDSAGGFVIGSHKKGAKGSIRKGPEEANGERWWYVDFENGVDGWVKERNLKTDNLSNATALREDTSLGARVENSREAELWSGPGGDKAGHSLVAISKRSARGHITDGPVSVDGKLWFYVVYDDGREGWVSEDFIERAGAMVAVARILRILLYFSYVLSFILLVGIVYSFLQLHQIRKQEILKIKQKQKLILANEHVKNERWERVVELANDDNPNSWRLAILEADHMLEELVRRMGYHGDTLGEMLKAVEKSDFNTIESAWEAHKVRNRIAHESGDYILTLRETLRVMELYRAIFSEFDII